MAKYVFTYFLNTACAERRPQTRRDLQEDWIVEEKEYPTDLEAFEYMYKKVYHDDEDYLFELYEDLPDQDDLTKINAIKQDFDNVDISDGSTIVISIEGPGQTYDSGFTKESFNIDYLDEYKKLNKNIKIGDHTIAYKDTQNLCDIISAMIDAYNFLGGNENLIDYLTDGDPSLIVTDIDDEPLKSIYNIELYSIDPTQLAWEASYKQYIPVKDEIDAIEKIKNILSLCEEEGIDLDELYNEMGVNIELDEYKKLKEDSSEESSLKDLDKAKFYKDCEDSGKFSDTQLRGIIWGFKHGLTVEQVAFFAKPEFDWEQMSEIEDGFRDGLSLDQIKFYATTKFAYDQMREIREGFNDGLSLDQIKFYATTKFAWDHMKEIRKGLAHGLTLDQVKVYADPKYNYLQMEEIREGFEHGLSMEQVKVYADPKYHCSEMREIREGFEHGLSIEQVKVYADHPWRYMEPIRKGLEMGLTIDQIKPYTDTKKYAWYDLSGIMKRLAYKYGLLKDTAEEAEEDDGWKELTTHVEVIETEEEPPYLSGYCDEELEIDDRNDLSENELWATGWSGTIKNIEKAPFKSFKDIDIVCSDNEKDKEYNLPDIPSKIQKEFVTKVNKWIKENPDKLDESKKLNEDYDGESKRYEVALTLDGDTKEIYNPVATNKKEAKQKALEMAKQDLYVSYIEKEDASYYVEVCMKEHNGSKDYRIQADSEEEAREEALHQAYLDIRVYYNYGESKHLTEDAQLEIDEQGLPVLERPYKLQKRKDNKFQITSYHPYDETEYAWAVSEDIDGIWRVYEPNPDYSIYLPINSRPAQSLFVDAVKGWNNALALVKKLDAMKTSNIDKT